MIGVREANHFMISEFTLIVLCWKIRSQFCVDFLPKNMPILG